MKVLNIICLTLVIIGGLNWLLVGAFQFDLVATLFGVNTPVSRAVYILVGLAAIYAISFYRNVCNCAIRNDYTATPATASRI